MQKNVGKTDSLIRLLLAAVLVVVALFLVDNAVLRIITAVVAAVLAITSFMSMCPIYHLLGKNTCDAEEPEEAPSATEEIAETPAPAEPEAAEVATPVEEEPRSTPEESEEPVERS
jgi:hypothetical protein